MQCETQDALLHWQVRGRLQKMGLFQPMNIFLRQEIDRMQRIIARVRSTLSDLKLAIDGKSLKNASLYSQTVVKTYGVPIQFICSIIECFRDKVTFQA